MTEENFFTEGGDRLSKAAIELAESELENIVQPIHEEYWHEAYIQWKKEKEKEEKEEFSFRMRPINKISELKVGDIVVHKLSKTSYVITGNYGQHAVGVRTIDISNPCEWDYKRSNNHEHDINS